MPLEEKELEILDAYLAQLQSGQRPDREAFLRDHPELASVLECLEALEKLRPKTEEIDDDGYILSSNVRQAAEDLPRSFGNYQLHAKIERKARRRAISSGFLTSTIIVFLFILVPFYKLHQDEPLSTAFSSVLYFSVFFSPLGGLAGGIGGYLRQVTLGAAISAIIFCSFGFYIASMPTKTSTIPLLYIPLFCCASGMMGALCGIVGAMFGQTCRKFEGKRLWPQFSIAELMAVVFLVAILMSCLVTLRQLLGKPR
jgi:hypothetical protein